MEYFQCVRPKRVDLKRKLVSHRASTGRRSWVSFTSFWFMVVVVLQNFGLSGFEHNGNSPSSPSTKYGILRFRSNGTQELRCGEILA